METFLNDLFPAFFDIIENLLSLSWLIYPIVAAFFLVIVFCVIDYILG